MKKSSFVFLLIAALLFSACGMNTEIVKGERVYTMGFGGVEIPLPEDSNQPLYIAGYNQGYTISGVLDLQRAQAVWLDDGRTSILLISIDCIGLGNETVAEIRARLQNFCKETGCDSVNVVSTHTHAGVDTLGLWGPVAQDGKNDAFMENLKDAAVQAAKLAYQDRTKGKLSYRITETVGMQEDSRSEAVFDSNLYQLIFTPEDSAYNGIRIVNFAAHAESLRGDNTLVSRDFPGVMGDIIHQSTGEDVMFLPGAIGGLIMTPKFVDRPFHAVSNLRETGQRMADYALAQGEQQELSPEIAISRVAFRTEMTNTIFMYYRFLGILQNQVQRTLSGHYEIQTELTVIQLGAVTLALMPGEVFPELVCGTGSDLDPEALNGIAYRLGHQNVIYVGLANDELGYIVPPSDYVLDEELPYFQQADGDHYEETNSVGKNCAFDLADAFAKALAGLKEN